jgi:hypothetical protein
MDVDKPHQLELLRTDLEKQQHKSGARGRTAAKKTTKAPAASKPAARTVKKASSAAKKTSRVRPGPKLKSGK